jgi:hypothetical protein
MSMTLNPLRFSGAIFRVSGSDFSSGAAEMAMDNLVREFRPRVSDPRVVPENVSLRVLCTDSKTDRMQVFVGAETLSGISGMALDMRDRWFRRFETPRQLLERAIQFANSAPFLKFVNEQLIRDLKFRNPEFAERAQHQKDAVFV